MTDKRALVIGSQLPPLFGVESDAKAMETLLLEHGFTVDLRIGAKASRDGILEGYDRLIRDVEPGGAAVFYYAGHGGYAVNASAGPGERTQLQCIFPTDWTETGEFRAILDIELSERLARLTDKTPNATVILDCCHSARLSRGPVDEPGVLVPRFYDASWTRGVPAFLARHPVDLTRVDVEGNPHAVRLVATAPDRRAFETTVAIDDAVVHRGVFTFTLERVLRETGNAPLTWQAIGDRVRELVIEHSREQVPVVEGPADRLIFTTQVVPRSDAVPLFYEEGRPFLRASRILGAIVGAEYDIMPPGIVEHDRAAVVARAEVVELVGANARVELEVVTRGQTSNPGAAAPQPGAGALAFPTKLPYPKLPVVIEGATADRLRDRVERRGELEPPRIVVVEEAAKARFAVVADGATLMMQEGKVIAGTPLTDDEPGRALLIQRLERWSRADALRTLTTEGLLRDAIDVQWGRVEHGQVMRHTAGECMHVGEMIYVSVTNRSERALYVGIFDVGIGGKVTLLTSSSPHGRKLEPAQSFTLGQRDGARDVQGIGPMIWPGDVPQTFVRPESIVVIAGSSWTDFGRLETEVLPAGRGPDSATPQSATRSAGPNRLEAILGGLRSGLVRDIGQPPSDGYCVHRIDFDLSPTPRSAIAPPLGAPGLTQAG